MLVVYGTRDGQTAKIATASGSVDVTRDHEYTDWEEVRSFAQTISKEWFPA